MSHASAPIAAIEAMPGRGVFIIACGTKRPAQVRAIIAALAEALHELEAGRPPEDPDALPADLVISVHRKAAEGLSREQLIDRLVNAEVVLEYTRQERDRAATRQDA